MILVIVNGLLSPAGLVPARPEAFLPVEQNFLERSDSKVIPLYILDTCCCFVSHSLTEHTSSVGGGIERDSRGCL